MSKSIFATLAVTLLLSHPAFGKDILVPAKDGSAQAVFASGSVEPGDTVILAAGNHGALTIKGKMFDKTVRLTSVSDGTAVLERLVIDRSVGIMAQNLTVLPSQPLPKWTAAVAITNSKHITLDQLYVSTAKETKGWGAKAWADKIRNGISAKGEHITITNSTVRNTQNGITSWADHTRVENNLIELFSGDGIRGLGDHSVYRGNTIKTCVKINKNHDDGFQSWSVGPNKKAGTGVIKDVVLDGNLIVNGTHKLTCQMQGIGLFDGIYEDWIITNNVIMVDQWHGITVLGANRVKIIGNTVIDSRLGRPGPPWIKIGPHKDGRPAKNSQIKNNITHTAKPKAAVPVPGVLRSGNQVARTAEQARALSKQ